MKASSHSSSSFIASLKECIRLKNLEKGHAIHLALQQNGFLQKDNPFVCSMLVDMYVKCGSISQAHEVFDMISDQNQDVVTWTTLIAGYTQSDNGGHMALRCFQRMQLEAVCPDAHTFSCILKACGSIGDIDTGKGVHITVGSSGILQKNAFVASAVVDMYAKCGIFVEAEKVLIALPARDVVMWTALISGYVDYECGIEALKCFEQMNRDRVFPSAVTYASVLKACGIVGDTEKGRDLHSEIAKRNLLRQDLVLGNALIGMYAKFGLLAEAKGVFDHMEVRDVVSWTMLIAGYADHDFGEEACVCYIKMRNERVSPDAHTFSSCLKACGNIGAAVRGEEIHSDIKRTESREQDLIIGTALVDMYAKCGLLDKAQIVFDKLSIRDKVLWNSLLTGYSQHGDVENVICVFEGMRGDGYEPHPVTFVGVINACAHGGLVGKGRMWFERMQKEFGILPLIEHHACMVDLYSRAGRLNEAVVMLNILPCHPNISMLLIILAACRKSNNLEVGILAFQQALGLDKRQSSAYVGMCNLYAEGDIREDKEDICIEVPDVGSPKNGFA